MQAPHDTAGAGAESAKASPLYGRIKADILQRIRKGEWRPGATIPGEVELARSYGCARMTVNRAIRELAGEGVLERRRRAGTRVAPFTGHSALLDIPRIDQEIERLGARVGYRLIGRKSVAADAELAARLDVAQGAPILEVTCLHLADGVPFQLERRWINLQAAPDAAGEDFASSGPNQWLLDHIAWSSVEHEVAALAAEPADAEVLGIARGAPILEISRRTRQGSRVVTLARLLHPGESYRLQARASVA
ncbi:histidine utilization repressor [Stappia sp. F7233]|uniref:Histidine utilization repressor n=1 Tax=Stappia albiluteola TaxID=2758565 RepID=A0A839ABV0_9HYPH|nr:histidine utilization repressor [Stappia albiluteola]MBA5777180.1 histidine utilization repressor [Stappia albiluteola]